MKWLYIKPEFIEQLNSEQLPSLLRTLLHCVAHKHKIPFQNINVSSATKINDGGIDGRIMLKINNKQDISNLQLEYIPSRLTIYQVKARKKFSQDDFIKEIFEKKNKSGDVKPAIDDVFSDGGAYILFKTYETSPVKTSEWIQAIKNKLKEKDKSYADNCEIKIYTPSIIAEWVNKYFIAILKVRKFLDLNTPTCFKTLQEWAQVADEKPWQVEFADDNDPSRYITVESRKDAISSIQESLLQVSECVLITGLSGLGKTRLVFEICRSDQYLRECAAYVDAEQNVDLVDNIQNIISSCHKNERASVIILDNCPYNMFKTLNRLIKTENSFCTLCMIGDKINDDDRCSLDRGIKLIQLDRMENDELGELLRPAYGQTLNDLDRITRFSDGFPKIAALLIRARLDATNDNPGRLRDEQLMNRLLFEKDKFDRFQQDKYKKVLMVCSLFEYFEYVENVNKDEQCEFIARFTGHDVTNQCVSECIDYFYTRGIIIKYGRYYKLVPQPLAVKLAEIWWGGGTLDAVKNDLIVNLPSCMQEPFCKRISTLDGSQHVKKITEKICGEGGHFGAAEVILSSWGSRLFRAITHINPSVITSSLWRVFSTLDRRSLLLITGDTRRNLIMILQKLIFHEGLFEQAGQMLYLLATAENEHWSNNATGIFKQIYRIELSGTSASPETKFSLLKTLIDQCHCDSYKSDVILEALDSAFDYGFASRASGPEYQGMREPLKEWRPTIYQDIYDYWKEAYDLLIVMVKKGEAQKKEVIRIAMDAVTLLAKANQMSLLEDIKENILNEDASSWRELIKKIKDTLKFTKGCLSEEATRALSKWMESLMPTDSEIDKRLYLYVINPIFEDSRTEDDKYIDNMILDAKDLAKQLSKQIALFYPYIKMLIESEPSHGYVFGCQLLQSCNDEEANQLVRNTLHALEKIKNPTGLNFLQGLFNALFDKPYTMWDSQLDLVSCNEHLMRYYPGLVVTGKVNEKHLNKCLELLKNKKVELNEFIAFIKNNTFELLDVCVINKFCIELSNFESEGIAIAFRILFYYCLNQPDKLGLHNEAVKNITSHIPLKSLQCDSQLLYNWLSTVLGLLDSMDNEYANNITILIVSYIRDETRSNLKNDYIKQLLIKLFEKYRSQTWEAISKEILSSLEQQNQAYGLHWCDVFNNNTSDSNDSLFSYIPVDAVLDWCKEPQAVLFVAQCTNVFEKESDASLGVSDLCLKILETFGENEEVVNILSCKICSATWSKPHEDYFEPRIEALEKLKQHKHKHVRDFAENNIDDLKDRMSRCKEFDEEIEIGAR